MSEQLFTAIETGYDSRNRIVYIAQNPDTKLYFVYKPRTGYKSDNFKNPDSPRLRKLYNRQIACSHTSVTPGDELQLTEPLTTPPAGNE